MNKFRLTSIGWLLAAAVLVPLCGHAQGTTSPYSLFGIGEVEMGNYGENSGMAGLGIGFRQDNALNPVNPASLTSIGPQFFVFEASAYGKLSRFQSQGDRYRAATGGLQRISIGFRAADRWMMSVGITPLSSVGYRIWADYPIEGTEYQSRTTFSGDGGLNRIYWSHGLQLTKNLSLGATGSVTFGTITHTENDGVWNIRESSRGQKIAFDFGLQWVQPLTEDTRLTLGAIGGTESTMNMRNIRTVVDASGNVITDRVYPTTQQRLPAFYGAGITFNRRNQLVFGVDYRYQKWSQTVQNVSYIRYKDMNKLTAGVSYIPRLLTTRGYWQLIKYQAGVTANDSYLWVGDEKRPLNYAATLGAVFPMMGGNTVNFAVEYGKFGTGGSHNALREDYLKFTLGFSFKDRWFLKMRYD